MNCVMYFYDPDTKKVYRKIIYGFGTCIERCLYALATGEIGCDCWNDVTEAEYNMCVETGEIIEDPEMITFDLT